MRSVPHVHIFLLAVALSFAGTVSPARSASQQAESRESGLRAEPVPPAVDALFHKVDVNDDGALSLAEFRNGWRRLHYRRGRQTAMAGLRAQFNRLDADDDGGIDRTEYPDMLLVKRAGPLALPFSQVRPKADSEKS